MIEKLRAYDKKSDLARVTGIDDGEEETVLDLSVKPEMKKDGLPMPTLPEERRTGTVERL